ncbi:MAG: hypothetical protein KDK26_05500 [Roseivivax sp.]|nr:hypothetical protein [Roseivivax sp.]
MIRVNTMRYAELEKIKIELNLNSYSAVMGELLKTFRKLNPTPDTAPGIKLRNTPEGICCMIDGYTARGVSHEESVKLGEAIHTYLNSETGKRITTEDYNYGVKGMGGAVSIRIGEDADPIALDPDRAAALADGLIRMATN